MAPSLISRIDPPNPWFDRCPFSRIDPPNSGSLRLNFAVRFSKTRVLVWRQMPSVYERKKELYQFAVRKNALRMKWETLETDLGLSQPSVQGLFGYESDLHWLHCLHGTGCTLLIWANNSLLLANICSFQWLMWSAFVLRIVCFLFRLRRCFFLAASASMVSI